MQEAGWKAWLTDSDSDLRKQFVSIAARLRARRVYGYERLPVVGHLVIRCLKGVRSRVGHKNVTLEVQPLTGPDLGCYGRNRLDIRYRPSYMQHFGKRASEQ